MWNYEPMDPNKDLDSINEFTSLSHEEYDNKRTHFKNKLNALYNEIKNRRNVESMNFIQYKIKYLQFRLLSETLNRFCLEYNRAINRRQRHVYSNRVRIHNYGIDIVEYSNNLEIPNYNITNMSKLDIIILHRAFSVICGDIFSQYNTFIRNVNKQINVYSNEKYESFLTMSEKYRSFFHDLIDNFNLTQQIVRTFEDIPMLAPLFSFEEIDTNLRKDNVLDCDVIIID